jgi:hypothetical protein
MEIVLVVDVQRDGTFEVYRRIEFPAILTNSVLVVDYDYQPWPTRGENLLW